MILKGDWKLIVYPYANKYRMYNLKKDPLEMNDVAGNVEYQSVLEELKAGLTKLQLEMGDDFDFTNPPPIDYEALKNFKKKSH